MFRRSSARRRRASARSSSSFFSFLGGNRCAAERALSYKRGFARRLGVETLEDRRMLAVNVWFDDVTDNFVITDDYVDNALQDDDGFPGADQVQEDNFVTLSNGVENPGWLRITDPLGVILEPGLNPFFSVQVNDTTVEIRFDEEFDTLRIDLQDGNDRLTFSSNFNLVEFIASVDVRGGGPSDPDVLTLNGSVDEAENVSIAPVDPIIFVAAPSMAEAQSILGYAPDGGADPVFITARGFERIVYLGSQGEDGLDDSLNVVLGDGVDSARVQNSSIEGRDEVLSESLPAISFGNLLDFEIESNAVTILGGNPSPITVTFVTDELEGSENYTFNSNALGDTLIIEGDGGRDDFAAFINAGGDLAVEDLAEGIVINTLDMTDEDLLVINTLGGDDFLTVDVDNGLIETPIFYDGGTGFDSLLVVGDPADADTVVDVVTYTPGLQVDEGRLEYNGEVDTGEDEEDITMIIDFDNLEPVTELVAAGELIVNGTHGDDFITYTFDSNNTFLGLVTVNGFETITFALKEELFIASQGGDDVVVLDNPLNPDGLRTITVVTEPGIFGFGGGNDEVRVLFLPDPDDTDFESVDIFTGNGDDIIDASGLNVAVPLTITAGAGNDYIRGGLGDDVINADADPLEGIVFVGDDTIVWSPGDDTIDGGGGADELLFLGDVDGNILEITQGADPDEIGVDFDQLGDGTVEFENLEHIRVELLAGKDALVIEVPEATLVRLPIHFDGGTGPDVLFVFGAFGDEVVDRVVYTPGLQVDEGRLDYQDAANDGQEMLITFENLDPDVEFDGLVFQPVSDQVDADILEVNGNGADNSITYEADEGQEDSGLVTVDGFAAISFNNKNILQINAHNGNDLVVLDNAEIPTGLTSVVVNGDGVGAASGGGNDIIRIVNLPADGGTFINAVVQADSGDDIIDASTLANNTQLILIGDAGNDTITGGPGIDDIDGGSGDDIIIASPGNDAVTGAEGDDQFHIFGRILADTITANQTDADTLLVSVNANDRNYTVDTLELVVIDGRQGDDLIAISVVDSAAPVATDLPFEVIGNSPNASDRLVVNDAGLGDLTIHRQGPDGRSGKINVGVKPPVTYHSIERVDITPMANMPGPGQTPGTGFTTNGGRVITFHYDALEHNNTMTDATALGSLAPVFLSQLNIDPGGVTLPMPWGNVPGDADWYEFRPTKIGSFKFDILFEHIPQFANGRAGLPGDGNLRLDVYRADGTLIASSNTSTVIAPNVDSSESVGISALANTSYFVRVSGASAAAINTYKLQMTETDDLGPQVFDPDGAGPLAAIFPNNLPNYNLFAPKPETDGASPLIFSLTINMRDLPVRFLGNPYLALDEIKSETRGLYQVIGDHVGFVDIVDVNVENEALANFIMNGTANGAGNATTFGINALLANQVPRVGDNITFTTGANANETRVITAIAGNSITVNAAFPAAPAANDQFTIASFAEARIILTFAQPLLDDRYTLRILDGVVDPVGNKLDGESDAAEPGGPVFDTANEFASGNRIAGGDFVARFTVDSRPELGAAVGADIDVDTNGNFVWDPANAQIGNDATNVDLSYLLLVQNGVNGPLAPGGFNVNDLMFSGKFTNGAPVPSKLYDQLAAFGYSQELGTHRWLIDTTNDGVVTLGTTDLRTNQATTVNGFNVTGAIPIAGNFNADIDDEVGLYSGGRWALDTNNNFVIDPADTFLNGNMLGVPVVGDFDGDGDDDLAVFNNNIFYFDLNRDGFTDAQLTMTWGFPGVLDKPVAADMNQDGVDDIGLWAPRDSASLPRQVAEWYFLVSTTQTAAVTAAANAADFTALNLKGNTKIAPGQTVRILDAHGRVTATGTVATFTPATGRITLTAPLAAAPAVGTIFSVGLGGQNNINALNHAFAPAPFGNDIYAEFGDELALPLLGNFDPPVTATVIAAPAIQADFNGSGGVDGFDFLAWQRGFGSTGVGFTKGDADGNGLVNTGDLNIWKTQFGQQVLPTNSAALTAGEGSSGSSIDADDAAAVLLTPTTATAPAAGDAVDEGALLWRTVALDAALDDDDAGSAGSAGGYSLSSDDDASADDVDDLFAEWAGVGSALYNDEDDSSAF